MSKKYSTTTKSTIRKEFQDTYFKRLIVAIIREYGEENDTLIIPYDIIESVQDSEGIEISDYDDETGFYKLECKEVKITNNWKIGEDDSGVDEEISIDNNLYSSNAIKNRKLRLVK